MTKHNLSKLIKRWDIASSDDGICAECPLRDDCKFRLEGKEAADSCYDVLAEWLLTHIKHEYKSPEITVRRKQMTILQNEKYRVSTIYSVTNGEMPLKYGLELCKKCENSDGWYVICHIKYDEHENWCDIQSVGTRMLDVPTDEWDDVKAMLDVANSLIIVENQLQNS